MISRETKIELARAILEAKLDVIKARKQLIATIKWVKGVK